MHTLGPYSVKSVGAALTVSWARGHNPGQVTTPTQDTSKEEEKGDEIGTILCAECWCCLSSFLGYLTQSWTGRHSDTVYQHAGTHFADLGRMTGRVNPTWY